MRAAARRRLETIRTRLRYGVAKPQETAALQEAARYFHIDMADERERSLLLAALAEFAFGKAEVGRKPGSKAWTDSELSKLYDAMQEHNHLVEATGHGVFSACLNLSDAELAKIIAKKLGADRKSGARGRFQSAEAIRRHLPAARDWYERWFVDVEPPDDWEPPEPDYGDQDD
jgi:hypothetical protein